jgi:hypothetical protein
LRPISDAKHSAIRVCRGVRKFKPILSDAEGRLWRASDKVSAAVREAEDSGAFDEILRQGDAVQVAKGVLAGVQAVLTATNGRVEILMPLFGGARASVPQGNVARP